MQACSGPVRACSGALELFFGNLIDGKTILWTTLWTKNFHSGKRFVLKQGSTAYVKKQENKYL
jgi:hypothetical protein